MNSQAAKPEIEGEATLRGSKVASLFLILAALCALFIDTVSPASHLLIKR